jgi:tetratricopeptide (TPR) repeat protein
MPARKKGRCVIALAAKICRRVRARPIQRKVKVALCLVLGVVVAAIVPNLWAWHQYREANRLVEQRHFSEAYAHYTRSLEIWRWSDSLQFQAARTARRAGLYAEAQRYLDACEKMQKSSADTPLPLALEHLLFRAETGDISEVEQPLWNYVEKNRADAPLILEGMARGYLRMLRLSAAMRCLRLLLDREPNNVVALVLSGETIQEGGGEIEEAVKDYRRALELDPQQHVARLKLAQILIRDRSEEARSHFEYLLAQRPDNLEAQLGLAQALRKSGDPENKARSLLESVLEKAPHNSKALMEMGDLVKDDGSMEEAEKLYRKAIAADRTNHLAHLRLYNCLAGLPGREEEAAKQIAEYEHVKADLESLGKIMSKEMANAPRDADLHYKIGKFYLDYGKPEIGLRWLYSALRLDPNHQPSHRMLHDYYTQAGDPEKAERHRKQLTSEP